MTYVKLEDVAAKLEALHDDGASIDGMIHRGELREALRSLPTDDGWEDIATAPRDGTRVLVTWKQDNVVGIVWCNTDSSYPNWTDGGFDSCGTPNQFDDDWFTGWRPLPAPPAC